MSAEARVSFFSFKLDILSSCFSNSFNCETLVLESIRYGGLFVLLFVSVLILHWFFRLHDRESWGLSFSCLCVSYSSIGLITLKVYCFNNACRVPCHHCLDVLEIGAEAWGLGFCPWQKSCSAQSRVYIEAPPVQPVLPPGLGKQDQSSATAQLLPDVLLRAKERFQAFSRNMVLP